MTGHAHRNNSVSSERLSSRRFWPTGRLSWCYLHLLAYLCPFQQKRPSNSLTLGEESKHSKWAWSLCHMTKVAVLSQLKQFSYPEYLEVIADRVEALCRLRSSRFTISPGRFASELTFAELYWRRWRWTRPKTCSLSHISESKWYLANLPGMMLVH